MNVKDKLVYVAGKFTSETSKDIYNCVKEAIDIGFEIIKDGGFPVIPHLSFYLYFEPKSDIARDLYLNSDKIIWNEINKDLNDYDYWLKHGIKILDKCDCIYLLDNWKDSNGARLEAKYAIENGIEFIGPNNNLKKICDVLNLPKELDNLTIVRNHIKQICSNIANMLIEKNKKYNNSALEPLHIFSKSPVIEQINDRIDDKLKRIRNQIQSGMKDDEDAEFDLIGYIVLKKIAKILGL